MLAFVHHVRCKSGGWEMHFFISDVQTFFLFETFPSGLHCSKWLSLFSFLKPLFESRDGWVVTRRWINRVRGRNKAMNSSWWRGTDCVWGRQLSFRKSQYGIWELSFVNSCSTRREKNLKRNDTQAAVNSLHLLWREVAKAKDDRSGQKGSLSNSQATTL